MYESNFVNLQKNNFLNENHRLSNYQNDHYQNNYGNQQAGKIHNQGFASLRNKYNLKI